MDKTPPPLEHPAHAPTRDALTDYARILGGYRRALVPPRKHWWHISLRPWLTGFETGPITTEAGDTFNLVLNMRSSSIDMMTGTGLTGRVALTGQPAIKVHQDMVALLQRGGLELPQITPPSDVHHPGYHRDAARYIGSALGWMADRMGRLRNTLRKETSAVQLWPHHFDLSMVWLSGRLIPGADEDDAEKSDEQVNLGFSLGDAGIVRPYLYITAYPVHEPWKQQDVLAPSRWHSEGWSGIVMGYADLGAATDPDAVLTDYWTRALEAASEATGG